MTYFVAVLKGVDGIDGVDVSCSTLTDGGGKKAFADPLLVAILYMKASSLHASSLSNSTWLWSFLRLRRFTVLLHWKFAASVFVFGVFETVTCAAVNLFE